jgi:hypothetical protein
MSERLLIKHDATQLNRPFKCAFLVVSNSTILTLLLYTVPGCVEDCKRVSPLLLPVLGPQELAQFVVLEVLRIQGLGGGRPQAILVRGGQYCGKHHVLVGGGGVVLVVVRKGRCKEGKGRAQADGAAALRGKGRDESLVDGRGGLWQLVLLLLLSCPGCCLHDCKRIVSLQGQQCLLLFNRRGLLLHPLLPQSSELALEDIPLFL